MYGHTIANIHLYVAKPNAETLLKGKVCEELGSITFNSHPSAQRIHNIGFNHYKATLFNQYLNIFHGTEKLNKFTAEFHIDKSVPPIAYPAHSIPFHLQDSIKKWNC